MKKVGIVDFGMGNINSICNALKFIGSEFTIVLKPDDLNNLTHIILPGVGSFKKAMTNLSSLDLVEKIRNSVLSEKKKNSRHLPWYATIGKIQYRRRLY